MISCISFIKGSSNILLAGLPRSMEVLKLMQDVVICHQITMSATFFYFLFFESALSQGVSISYPNRIAFRDN